MNKRKKSASLWFAFVVCTFFVLIATSIVMAPLAYLVSHLKPFGPNPVAPILVVLFFSVVLGTGISAVVGKKLLRPINAMSKATKAVAAGDFSVRLDADQQVNELQEIFTNFNTMAQELGSIETLRNDFVVNVSHEFKTPIAAIEGCATLLQDETATLEERREYTGMILDAARQLSTLTGNILKLSKLESSNMPVEKSDFQLDEQVRQAVLMLEKEWEAKDIQLDIDLDTVTYCGNAELLMQVWLNLFTNAIKYSNPGGKVAVALYRTGKGISVQVEDKGIGMPEDVQRHVFDKFYQGDTARKAQGNGLGLTLVQRIVSQHGGTVSVKSEVGAGSVFTVRLPA